MSCGKCGRFTRTVDGICLKCMKSMEQVIVKPNIYKPLTETENIIHSYYEARLTWSPTPFFEGLVIGLNEPSKYKKTTGEQLQIE